MRILKRILWILPFLALLGQVSQVQAASRPNTQIAIEAFSGRVLYSKNADQQIYPASLTKMMSLYLVFDEIKAGRLSMNSRLKVSKKAASAPPSKLGLKPGETIKVKDAMYALITKSANDVAIVVAENIAGSEAAFAKRMTNKARALGMSKTTFKNASGLPNSGQVTTARDMAMLGRSLLLHHNGYYHYFSTQNYRYKNYNYKNHNKLLKEYEGVDGIKTGYINASGFNLVASARKGDKRIIAVVIGGDTSNARNLQMKNLLDESFERLTRVRPTWIKVAARPKVTYGLDPAIAEVLNAQNRVIPPAGPERPAHLTIQQPIMAKASQENQPEPVLIQAVEKIDNLPSAEVQLKDKIFKVLNVKDGRYAIILQPETSLEKARQTGTETQRAIEKIIDYSKVQIAYTDDKYYTPIINNLWGQDAITACQLIVVQGLSCLIKEKNVG